MLLFRIAETIGGHTVEDLERKMSWGEVREWEAYFGEQKRQREEETARLRNKGGGEGGPTKQPRAPRRKR